METEFNVLRVNDAIILNELIKHARNHIHKGGNEKNDIGLTQQTERFSLSLSLSLRRFKQWIEIEMINNHNIQCYPGVDTFSTDFLIRYKYKC